MTTLALSFLNGTLLFLQVTRTNIKAWMGLNFGPTPPLALELAAHGHLKINVQSCDHSSASQFLFYLLHSCRLLGQP